VLPFFPLLYIVYCTYFPVTDDPRTKTRLFAYGNGVWTSRKNSGGQHATFGILLFISIFAGSRTLARECVLEHSILSD
jgi:hypothetical protein